MTKVDFYILSSDSIEQQHTFACRLAEKAYSLGHKIYIHMSDATQAESMDHRLWSFRASSFIPHASTTTDADHETHPILIGHDQSHHKSVDNHYDLMINLSINIPDFFSRFSRVSEIVIQEQTIKAASRENYRFYKSRGYQLTDRKIDA